MNNSMDNLAPNRNKNKNLKEQNFTDQILQNIYYLWTLAFCLDKNTQQKWIENNLDKVKQMTNGTYVLDISKVVDEPNYPTYICPLDWIFQSENALPLNIEAITPTALFIDYQPIEHIGRLTALTLALSLIERQFPGRYLFAASENIRKTLSSRILNTERTILFDDQYPVTHSTFTVFARQSHPLLSTENYLNLPIGNENDYYACTQQVLPNCILVPPLLQTSYDHLAIIDAVSLALQLEKIMSIITRHLAPNTLMYLNSELLQPWQNHL